MLWRKSLGNQFLLSTSAHPHAHLLVSQQQLRLTSVWLRKFYLRNLKIISLPVCVCIKANCSFCLINSFPLTCFERAGGDRIITNCTHLSCWVTAVSGWWVSPNPDILVWCVLETLTRTCVCVCLCVCVCAYYVCLCPLVISQYSSHRVKYGYNMVAEVQCLCSTTEMQDCCCMTSRDICQHCISPKQY